MDQSVRQTKGRRGFALVITLSLMMMLSMLAVGALVLSSSALRTAARGAAQGEAQANARMALALALGELQLQMGPDQRISANASILSEDAVANPNWTGVWDSWIAGPIPDSVNDDYPSGVSHHQTLGNQPDASMRPEYSSKDRHFRRWLVSLDDSISGGSERSEASLLATGASRSLNGVSMPVRDSSAVRLVGEGTVGAPDPTSFVSAQLLPIRGTAASDLSGRHAWWVGDESQKASIMEDSYQSEEVISLQQRLFRQQAPASMDNSKIPGLQTVVDRSVFSKLPSRNTISLIGNDAYLATQQFHDVTPNSFGVLADVREGGLKRDLSTILERPIDPNEVYNLVNQSDFHRATSFTAAGESFILYHFDDMSPSQWPTGQASVPIQDLAAYYQLYDHYRPGWKGGIQYSSANSSPPNTLLNSGIMVSNPDFGGTQADGEKFLRQYTAQYRSAVPVKIETVLSYVTEERTQAEIDAAITAGTEPDPANPDTHVLKMGITPSMTFWNPNNVPLVMNIGNPEHSSLFLRHRPIPVEIRIRKSTTPTGPAVRTHTVQLNRVTNNQQDELFTLFASGRYPAVFQPGESKVLSLQFTSQTNAAAGQTDLDFYVRGTGYRFREPFVPTLELIPGWNPDRFIRPTNRQAQSRVATSITFKESDYISAEIVGGAATDFDTHFSQKSRHGRNQPGVKWHYRSYNLQGRISSPADYRRSLAHLGFPNPGAGVIASAAARSINVLPRRGQRLIDAMGDPTDLTDDIPESFLYYAVKAGVETHESSNMMAASAAVPSGRRFPSRPFLHSTPLQPGYIDRLEGNSHYNYGWNWFFRPIDNHFDAGIPISVDNHGYIGGGYTALKGTTHVVQQQLPLTPPISIASLSHARLGGYSLATEAPNSNGENQRRVTAVGHAGLAPATLQAVGNSYAHPNIPPDRAVTTWTRTFTGNVDSSNPLADHSYLANKALWDKFYFSSIFPRNTNVRIMNETRTVRDVCMAFFFGQEDLPNRRILPYAGSLTEANLDELLGQYEVFTDGFADRIAAHIMVRGPFNINSTSLTAWKALLSSLKGSPVAYLDKDLALTQGVTLNESTPTGVPIGSGTVGNRGTYIGSPSDPGDPDQWLGTRELTVDEIDELARAVVRHVKMRGPFLSLSEFVNRRLDSGNRDFALKGTLQAALDDPDVSINSGFNNPERSFSSAEASYVGAAFPEAMQGPIAYGSAAYVDQANILAKLPAQLTVRGDTFVIRAYGEALDADGNVIARAWCEATVQRVPEYVDQTDAPHTVQAQLLSAANANFGRQFKITQFRWLSPSEI